MRIIAYTKYGIFEGKNADYNEAEYKRIGQLLEYLPKLEYFSFETDRGEIYMTREMIANTLFVLER
jgi:hypothetical protein